MSVKLFLSSVTVEFPGYREELRGQLTHDHVEIKVQEDIKGYGFPTLEELDRYIATCDAVIHLAGEMAGAAVPADAAQAFIVQRPRLLEKFAPLRDALSAGCALSYTQWEAWLALDHGKPLKIYRPVSSPAAAPATSVPGGSPPMSQSEHLASLARLDFHPTPFETVDRLAAQISTTLLVDLLRKAGAARQPGRLVGATDNRLIPREATVLGRQDEIAEVVAFLRGMADAAVVTAHVTGVGGIGKTEVCKAALRQWMGERPDAVVFYVNVPDEATADGLVYDIARAIGVDGIETLEQLLPAMPAGLYYLDNLESVTEDPRGFATLRMLKEQPGVRILASSRVGLSGLFGKPIDVGRLPLPAALGLFRSLWESDDPPAEEALTSFVEDQLGCHALSVALTARLGRECPFTELTSRWASVGTASAGLSQGESRLDSLQVSLRLTAQVLARTDGALTLWTAAAMFATGLPNEVLIELERLAGLNAARSRLVNHNLLTRVGDRWQMLPPVGRFALDMSAEDRLGFDWAAGRQLLRSLFEPAVDRADDIASTAEALAARSWLLEHFGAWSRLVRHELAGKAPDQDWLQRMLVRTRNLYPFSGALAVDVLRDMASKLARPSLALHLLGDLESRLGRLDEARTLYDRALKLFEGEQSGLGQANTLKALGDLER